MVASLASGVAPIVAVVVVAGYLIGSVPIANLVAGLRAGIDLRQVGDRNPGYWNARTVLGPRAARVVFVGDVAKGLAAAGVGLALGDDWWMPYVGTGAAMLGHAAPIVAGFRGGRSVLTFVGGAIVCSPASAAVAIAVLLVVYVWRRRFADAARAGVIAFPVAQLLIDGPWRTAATGVLMTFIGVRFAQAWWSERRTGAASTSAGG